MAVGLGAVNKAPISGFYGWLAVESWFVYVIAIATGSAIIAVGSLLVFNGEQTTTPAKSEPAPKFTVSR